MPLSGAYEPSTYDFVREQVELYERTGGREGNLVDGLPVIILSTIGARTGALRKSPLMRLERDSVYAVVGSVGGLPHQPGWYRNLLQDPRCAVQDGTRPRDMLAREASESERASWWELAVEHFPHFQEMQGKTTRRFPVVLLEPADGA